MVPTTPSKCRIKIYFPTWDFLRLKWTLYVTDPGHFSGVRGIISIIEEKDSLVEISDEVDDLSIFLDEDSPVYGDLSMGLVIFLFPTSVVCFLLT